MPSWSFSTCQLWFPGESLWELWLVRGGKAVQLLEREESFEALRFRGIVLPKVLALPANWIASVPFQDSCITKGKDHSWIVSARKRVAAAAPGCDPNGIGAVLVSQAGESRRLRIDAPLRDPERVSSWKRKPNLTAAAPSLFHLPPRSIAIWKELGNQVIAFERNGQVAYYESFPQASEHQTAQYLLDLTLRLQAEQAILAPKEIHLWNRSSPFCYERIFEIPVKRGFRPRPDRLRGAANMRPAWLCDPPGKRFKEAKAKVGELGRAARTFLCVAGSVFAVCLLAGLAAASFFGAPKQAAGDLPPKESSRTNQDPSVAEIDWALGSSAE